MCVMSGGGGGVVWVTQFQIISEIIVQELIMDQIQNLINLVLQMRIIFKSYMRISSELIAE